MPVWIQDNHNAEKKNKKIYRFQIAAKIQIFIRKPSYVSKIWKSFSPKEFFNEILVKVGEHEYIYIAEIKFGKLFRFKMAAKIFLSYRQKCLFMLISEENGPTDFSFFQSSKTRGEKYLRALTGDSKSKLLGPGGPPCVH